MARERGHPLRPVHNALTEVMARMTSNMFVLLIGLPALIVGFAALGFLAAALHERLRH
jgi:hypothetical protein